MNEFQFVLEVHVARKGWFAKFAAAKKMAACIQGGAPNLMGFVRVSDLLQVNGSVSRALIVEFRGRQFGNFLSIQKALDVAKELVKESFKGGLLSEPELVCEPVLADQHFAFAARRAIGACLGEE